jgi:RNA polymerase sigma factor (sigma-70 family)
MDPEQQISKCLQAHDFRGAFDLLVAAYARSLYHHIRAMVPAHEDADDLLQEVFIKIWKGLPGFREDAKAYTWAYRIATNETLTWLKRHKKRQMLSMEAVQEPQAITNLPEADQIQAIFEKGLAQLPPKQALVFRLRYFDELPFQEISDRLGTSKGALKASYHLAFKKLENWIKLNHHEF